ncbi:hypothetical protein ACRAWG_28090 [Methylobacterium sp. P31]
MGVYFHWGILAACTFILVLWQAAIWIFATEFRLYGLLMLAAYVFALQSGYLLGVYLSVKLEE